MLKGRKELTTNKRPKEIMNDRTDERKMEGNMNPEVGGEEGKEKDE